MILRRLNTKGVRAFREFVGHVKQTGLGHPPVNLLTDEQTSEALPKAVDLDAKRVFGSRYDFGEYLADRLPAESLPDLFSDPGIWDAIALVYFDQLCPRGSDGKRVVREPHNYCLSDFQFHRVRHAAYMTYLLVSNHGEASRFLLSKGMETRGELMEQLMSRQYYLACDGVVKAASRLYYDPETETFKRGAAGRKSKGCISRFVSWLQQLEATYDLYSLGPDQIDHLLPPEFDRFR